MTNSNFISKIKSVFTLSSTGSSLWILAILSGVFVGTSYVPFQPWAIFFSYTPLWIAATRTDDIKKTFWLGWLTQFILTFIGFHWIAYTTVVFGNLPYWVGAAALILFAAFMHIYIALAVTAAKWIQKKWSLSVLSFFLLTALFHSLLERFWPSIFNWHLGYTLLWAKIPAYHWADMIGFEGLSGLLLISQALLAWAIYDSKNNRSLYSLVVCIFFWIALCVGGPERAKSWGRNTEAIEATVIQGNIGNVEKVYAEKGKGYQAEIITRFSQKTLEAYSKFPDTELFVWPETAFPDLMNSEAQGSVTLESMRSQLKSLNRTLLTGAYSQVNGMNYNALFLTKTDGENLANPYHKHQLLAFGEYLPLSEQFPFLLKLLPFISNFGRGPGPEVIPWKQKNIQFGPQICYEGLDPSVTRQLSEKGADILVNVTNDSWFGWWFEPFQHMTMTLARGIEVRRPLIRSTNTGVSTAILATGQVLEKTPMNQETFAHFLIKYKKQASQTDFVLWGHYDWVLYILLALFLITKGIYHERIQRP